MISSSTNLSSLLVLLACLATLTTSKISHCKTLGVSQENTEICLNCEEGYYVNVTAGLKTCYACDLNCEKCISDSGDTVLRCLECDDGFMLGNDARGSCLACPKGCEKCLSNQTCTECEDGYKLDSATNLCKSSSKVWKIIFIIVVILGAVGGGWYLYTKYFATQRAGVYATDYEEQAYKNANSGNKNGSPGEINKKKLESDY